MMGILRSFRVDLTPSQPRGKVTLDNVVELEDVVVIQWETSSNPTSVGSGPWGDVSIQVGDQDLAKSVSAVVFSPGSDRPNLRMPLAPGTVASAEFDFSLTPSTLTKVEVIFFCRRHR